MLTSNPTVSRWCVVAGAHLLLTPITLIWIHGNLSEYINSYFHFHCGSKCKDANEEWMLGTYLVTGSLGAFLCHFFTKRIGLRLTTLAVCVVFCVSLVCLYFVISLSILGVILLYFMAGLAASHAFTLGYVYIQIAIPEKVAFFSASATSSPLVSAIIQNQIITAYVNPGNLKPDVHIGSKVFFTDKQLLERVPSIFLILAIWSAVSHVVGNLLLNQVSASQDRRKIRESEEKIEARNGSDAFKETVSRKSEVETPGQRDGRTQSTEDSQRKKTLEVGKQTLFPAGNGSNYKTFHSSGLQETFDGSHLVKSGKTDENLRDTYKTEVSPVGVSSKDTASESKSIKGYSSNDPVEPKISPNDHVTSMDGTSLEVVRDESPTKRILLQEEAPSDSASTAMSFRQALRTRATYIILLSNTTLVSALVLKNTYYKQFGLIYIRDDDFQTLVGSLYPFVIIPSRLFLGKALDKNIVDVKGALVLALSVNSVMCAYVYLTPMAGKVLYCVWILVMAASHALAYVIFPMAVLERFGRTNFQAIYAFTMNGMSMGAMLTPALVNLLLPPFGWFTVFSVFSGISTFTLTMVVFLF